MRRSPAWCARTSASQLRGPGCGVHRGVSGAVSAPFRISVRAETCVSFCGLIRFRRSRFLPDCGSSWQHASVEDGMSPARKRRRLPTLIDRGLGLLEVIVHRGPCDELMTLLHVRHMDGGGFWIPN